MNSPKPIEAQVICRGPRERGVPRAKARWRYSPFTGFWALTHDSFIPHSPSIGKAPSADVKSAGGSTAIPSAARAFRSSPIGSGSLADGTFAGGSPSGFAARAFISAPASTALVIAPIRSVRIT